MIKDFGNSKLDRFRAGEPLLGQVTAERLNDILAMVEACRLQNGVGYMLNRSAGGTTFTILDNEYNRPPKLWKVGLSDIDLDPATLISKVIKAVMDEIIKAVSDPGQFAGIFSRFLSQIIGAITTGDAGSASGVKNMIEGTMTPIYQIIDTVDGKIEELFGKVDPIRLTLENYFTSRGKRPRSGDMVYADEVGICYTLYKEVTDDEGTYPTPNLIFRVPFMLGKNEEGEGGTTFYALTTFPTPDIAECAKTVLKAVVDFVVKLLGSTFEGMVQAVMDSVSKAIYALYKMIMDLIEMILEMIQELFATLERLAEAIDLLAKDFSEIFNDDPENPGKIQGIEKDIAGIGESISGLKNILDAALDINVVGVDGKAHSIKVLADVTGADLRQQIAWIGCDGNGHKANALIWDHETPFIDKVDWRDVEFLDGDGTSRKRKFLVVPAEDPGEDTGKIKLREVEYVGATGKSYRNKFVVKDELSEETGSIGPQEIIVCEDGQSTQKTFIVKNGGD